MIMTIGEAIWNVKLGHKIARKGWNGTGMFVYYVAPGKYPAKMDVIKGVFKDDLVPYGSYLAIKTAQNTVQPWAPSGSDTLAEDWEVVE